MTRDEMLELLPVEVRKLNDYLTDEDYSNACNDASRETGWGFPVTDDFQVLWMKNRAKRHLFFYLLSESAHKFKYEGISLNQRFEHYLALVKQMDSDFKKVQETSPEEFMTGDSYLLFGTKIDAGFSYDEIGEDTTFFTDNQVTSSYDE